MSAVTVYCFNHHGNHELTARDAEDAIQSLIAEWADEATAPTGIEAGRAGWEVTAEFCVLRWLQAARDPEMYYEHLESAREGRLVAAARPPVSS